MSSSAQDASTGSSTLSGQSSTDSAEQPKRSTSLGQHSSSWINRFYGRDDGKHHRSDIDVERPLLANDRINEGDEKVQSQLNQPSQIATFSSPRNRPWGWLLIAKDHIRKAYEHSRNFSVRNTIEIVSAILVALILLLIYICISSLFYGDSDDKPLTCQSAACVHAASEILYNLDPNHAKMDPCTQFDKMVCGGWELRHDLRPDQGDMFTGTIMAENSKTILRHILEQNSSKLSSSPADQDNFKKLKDAYDSCMNEQELEKIGLKPLQDIVDRIKLSFPTAVSRTGQNVFSPLETSTEKDATSDGFNQLTNTLILLIKSDISALLDFHVQADDRDPDTQVVMVTPPGEIGLPSKEYYKNDELVNEYREMSVQVLQQFLEHSPGNTTLANGRRRDISSDNPHYQIAPTRELEDLVRDVVDLEVKLAAATPTTEDQADVTKYYNPMTVAETQSLIPLVSVKHFFSQLAPEGYSPKKIIAGSPSYMTALSKLLSNSKNETLQAFFAWRAIQQYEKTVEDPSLLSLRAFNNKLRGLDPSAKEERWRTCIDAVDHDLGWILSKFFVEAAFSETSKHFGDQIVTDIKDTFAHFLNHTEWMTPAVRHRAMQKVHAIDQKIGYPTTNPNILDPTALKTYYTPLPITNTTFFTNSLHAREFLIQQSWAKLAHPTRHDEWDMTVPTVNAYYNPAGNEIVFPAGIMQPPVFYGDPSVPSYLSYGAFAAVAGHELSHAFDSTGAHYDESGNYTDWFDDATLVAFKQRTRCFEKQYAGFNVTDRDGRQVPVNGKLTLGENIADAGGVHAAFVAWRGREGPRVALPGLWELFTPEQLFFVSYANWWCGKSTVEKAVERIYTDPHAPKWARILGTMDNSAEFKKAFHCENREPTCRLW